MLSTFYKLVFDISCYFTFASFLFAYIFEYETNPATYGIFLIAALLTASSERMKRGENAVKIVSLVLPAMALLWERTWMGRLELLLPWAYYMLLFLKNGYSMYHETFVGRFRLLLWALALPAILYLLDLEKGEPALEQCLPYILVFLTAGVLFMQLLRYQEGAGNKKDFEQHQIKQTLVFFLFAVLVTVGNLLEFLVKGIIQPLALWLFGSVMGVLHYVTSKLTKRSIGEFNDKRDIKEFFEQTPYFQDRPDSARGDLGMMVAQQLEEDPLPDYTLLFILAILVVIVILFVVMVGEAGKKKRAPLVEDEREELEDVAVPEKKLRRRSIHPELVIRYHYRTFKKLVNGKENRLAPSDTTEEIAKKYTEKKAQNAAGAEELTKLYRKARYSKAEVTRQDAARMKVLMKEI